MEHHSGLHKKQNNTALCLFHQPCMAGITYAEVEMETQRRERIHLSSLEGDEAELKYQFRKLLPICGHLMIPSPFLGQEKHPVPYWDRGRYTDTPNYRVNTGPKVATQTPERFAF